MSVDFFHARFMFPPNKIPIHLNSVEVNHPSIIPLLSLLLLCWCHSCVFAGCCAHSVSELVKCNKHETNRQRKRHTANGNSQLNHCRRKPKFRISLDGKIIQTKNALEREVICLTQLSSAWVFSLSW